MFRIGVARTYDTVLNPGTDNIDSVSALMEEQGAAWGMRKEICVRVVEALHEFLVAMQMLGVSAPVKTRLRFDELKFIAALEYAGPDLVIPKAAPTAEDLVAGRATVSELSTYMLRQHTDHVRVSHDNGSCRVYLHFDH